MKSIMEGLKEMNVILQNECHPTIEKLEKICTVLNTNIVSFFLYDVSSDNCFLN